MQDFVYSHAPVESAKAVNFHDLSSDWINLKEQTISNGTCSIACGKHVWNKFHIRFQFPRYVFLMCSKNICGKHTVETRLKVSRSPLVRRTSKRFWNWQIQIPSSSQKAQRATSSVSFILASYMQVLTGKLGIRCPNISNSYRGFVSRVMTKPVYAIC